MAISLTSRSVAVMLLANARATASSWSPVPIVSLLLVGGPNTVTVAVSSKKDEKH
jgi:hypothetical protein